MKLIHLVCIRSAGTNNSTRIWVTSDYWCSTAVCGRNTVWQHISFMTLNPDYFRTDPATTGFYLQHQHTTLILLFHSVNISLSFYILIVSVMDFVSFTILASCLFQSFVYGSVSSKPTLSTSNSRILSCQNSPTSRSCWGQYSIDTDYYSITPTTGVTRGRDSLSSEN